MIKRHTMHRIYLISLATTFIVAQTLSQQAMLTVHCATSSDSMPVTYYFARIRSTNGSVVDSAYSGNGDSVRFILSVTAIHEDQDAVPHSLKLEQNYPNPFNPSTIIEFQVAHQENVMLAIFNILGQKIKTITEREFSPGIYHAVWQGDNDNGQNVSQGVFFYRLSTGNDQITKKMVYFGGGSGSSYVVTNNPPTTAMTQKVTASYELDIRNLSETYPPIHDTAYAITFDHAMTLSLRAQRWMRTISGTLIDDENKPQIGYILGVNSRGDTSITMSDSSGVYSLQTVPNAGDTIKGHIIYPGKNEAFIRKIYIAGNNDASNVLIDAVPSLADSVYIGLDTLANFAWELNFRPGIISGKLTEGLSVTDLTQPETISSIVDYGTYKDTIKDYEQTNLIHVINQKLNSHFKKQPPIYIVPQDSTMTSPPLDGISWFKDHLGQVGQLGVVDANEDGINERAIVQVNYLNFILPSGDTLTNYKGILKEGFGSRVGGGEVSPPQALIRPDQTVAHANSSTKQLTAADDWIIHICEHYPPKTSFYLTLFTDYYENTYSRLHH